MGGMPAHQKPGVQGLPSAAKRPALAAAVSGDVESVRERIEADEREERPKDREYWAPLKQEFGQLRLARGKRPT
jgi:hypothetical protein